MVGLWVKLPHLSKKILESRDSPQTQLLGEGSSGPCHPCARPSWSSRLRAQAGEATRRVNQPALPQEPWVDANLGISGVRGRVRNPHTPDPLRGSHERPAYKDVI